MSAGLTAGEQNRLIIEHVSLTTANAAIFRGQKDIPFEDLESEAMLALVRAARTWRREAQFSTFATRCIRNALINFVDDWQVFDTLDERAAENEERIFEWQVWGILPAEGWTVLGASPEQINETYQEYGAKAAAVQAAMLSLSPRQRKMVQAHFMRDPRVGIAQIARDHGVSYHSAIRTLRDAVTKLGDVVMRQMENQARRSAA